jgi:uncharacterized protein with HEPN domain
MNSRTPANLWELRRACSHLLERTADKTAADLRADYDLSLVVERLFERIGETLRRIHDSDPATVERIDGYRRAINLRNIIAHQYYNVDWTRIRTFIDGPVPEMLASIDELIAEIPKELQ